MRIDNLPTPLFGFDTSPSISWRIVFSLIFSTLIITLVDVFISFTSTNVIFYLLLTIWAIILIVRVFYLNLQEGLRIKGITRTGEGVQLSGKIVGGDVFISYSQIVSEEFYDLDGFYTYRAVVQNVEFAHNSTCVHQLGEHLHEINYPLGIIAPDDFNSSAFVKDMRNKK